MLPGLPKGVVFAPATELHAVCLLHASHACKHAHCLAAGHVTNCTGGAWHPVEKTTALTSSEDGTLRVWDVMELQQKTVIKPQVRRAMPRRASAG